MDHLMNIKKRETETLNYNFNKVESILVIYLQ